MRVKHLLIVSFGAASSSADEVTGAVNALASKYLSRSEVLSICHVPANIDEGRIAIGKPDELKTCSSMTGGTARDYGAYLVFHYGGTFKGQYTIGAKFVDGISNGDEKTDGAGIANVLAGIAFKKRNMPALGKVCLVACNVANPDSNNPFLAEAFCETLAHRCLNVDEKDPPLVAGWDTFVTVAFPENNAIGKTLQKTIEPGHKVAKGDSGKVHAKQASAHKWVWVWNGSQYDRKPVAESGWSDSMQAQKTSDNKVAVIPLAN